MKTFFSSEYSRWRDLLAVQCASERILYAPSEFKTYLKAVSEALAKSPSSKVLYNLSLSIALWTVARTGDETCSFRLANEVSSLEKELAIALDDAISKVLCTDKAICQANEI